MSKTVTIPSYTRPYWECCINGVMYRYTSGSAQEVPDEVAALIENNLNQKPKEPVSAKHSDYDLVICCSENFSSSLKASSFFVESGDGEMVIEAMEKGQMPRIRIYAQRNYGAGPYFDDAVIYRVFIAEENIGVASICNVGRLNLSIHKDRLEIRSVVVTEW